MKFSIKQARNFSGKTQEELAKALNIHVQTYRVIENEPEKATLQQLEIIARETGMNTDNFFYGEYPLIVE